MWRWELRRKSEPTIQPETTNPESICLERFVEDKTDETDDVYRDTAVKIQKWIQTTQSTK
jgi:hypothetical protein